MSTRTVGKVTHPKWEHINVMNLGKELTKMTNKNQRTVHQWNNLVFTDGNVVTKLNTADTYTKMVNSVHITNTVAAHNIPTTQAIAEPDIVELNGTLWARSQWKHEQLRTLTIEECNGQDVYEWLGFTLAHVHGLAVLPGMSRHDPLKWAESRVDLLQDTEDVTQLRLQLNELQGRLTAEPGPAVFVHADVHLDNVVLSERGLLLLDFEDAGYGSAGFDLIPSAGWVKRTGSPTQPLMEALQNGYTQVKEWPDLNSLKPVLADVQMFSRYTWELLNGARKIPIDNKKQSSAEINSRGFSR